MRPSWNEVRVRAAAFADKWRQAGYEKGETQSFYTFPTPPESADPVSSTGQALSKLEPLAQAVLDARAAHPGATLAELYVPELMRPNLRRAHQALDRTVDRLYRPGGFASERKRVEHLFMLYEKMRAPLEAARQVKPRRRRARRSGI